MSFIDFCYYCNKTHNRMPLPGVLTALLLLYIIIITQPELTLALPMSLLNQTVKLFPFPRLSFSRLPHVLLP